MGTPSPARAVISVNVPSWLFRYSADDDGEGGRPGQFIEFTKNTSCHPSPSASKKTTPEPIVSGRYFFPNAPLLCAKRIPACRVTSVNVSDGSGAGAALIVTAAARTLIATIGFHIVVISLTRVRPRHTRRSPACARGSVGARCYPRDAAAGTVR